MPGENITPQTFLMTLWNWHFSWQNHLASLNNQLTTNLEARAGAAIALGSLPARFSVQSNAFHAPPPGGRAALPSPYLSSPMPTSHLICSLKPSAALHQQSGIIIQWRRSRQTDTLWLAESHLQGDGRWKWYSLSRWDNGTGVEELAGAAEERKMKMKKKRSSRHTDTEGENGRGNTSY